MPKAIASLGLVETCRKRRVWGALSAGRCTSRRLESLQIVSKTVLWQFIDVYSTFRSHFSVLPFSCLLFVCAVSSQSFCRFSRLEATWNKIRAQRSWRMWVSLMMEPQCRTGEQSRMLNIVGTSCDKFILDSGGLTVYFLFGRMKASWKWILKPRACLTSEDMTPKLTTPLAIPWKVGLKEELVILFNAHLVNKEHLYSIDWNLRHCEALAIHWSSGATRNSRPLFVVPLRHGSVAASEAHPPWIPWIPWMTGTWVQERVPKWIGQCFSMTLPKLPATASVSLSCPELHLPTVIELIERIEPISNMQNMQTLPALDLVWGLALKFPLSFVDLPACAQLSVCGLKT